MHKKLHAKAIIGGVRMECMRLWHKISLAKQNQTLSIQ